MWHHHTTYCHACFVFPCSHSIKLFVCFSCVVQKVLSVCCLPELNTKLK